MVARKVKLESIKSLTLHAGRKTASRRVDPVPQLVCKRNCKHAPQVVQCTQTGSDGVAPQWKCEADLPPGVGFGPLEVVCEGWARAGDTNVLAGSCGLEYELEGRPEGSGSFSAFTSPSAKDVDYAGIAIKTVWILAALFFLYRITSSCFRVRWEPGRHPRRPGAGPGGPGFGGGPGGGDDWPGAGGGAPPPPYMKDDPASTRPAQGLGARSHAQPQQGGGWGAPGFWTGMMTGAGAAAAYGLANRNRGQQQQQEDRADRQDFARWRANRPAQRTWDDYEPSEAGPSRRAAGYGGSRTR